jgi:RHS repeat-associated protein
VGQRLARSVSGDIKYYITDHLHSTAMFVDKAGTTAAILDDNDMYPWGGIVPGVGKTTSNNTVKFTGKYRDSESQLDYFGARYYSNTIGRFMSPDWAAAPTTVPYAKFGDPQSLNLYSYVENGPINRIDADGHSYAGVDGLNRDESAGVPMTTWDELDEDLKNKPNPSPTPSPSPNTQSQDTGGFWQKLGNVLTGNGWKTNTQVIAEQRQWLTDHKVQQMDRDGNKKSMDWSKATDTQVTEAYKYIQSVYSAARSNKQLVELGLAATVVFGHGARHLEGSGLKQDAVESAINEDVQATIKGATQPTTNFWGRVTVDGKVIEYRAYTLPSGTINVGTYYIP